MTSRASLVAGLLSGAVVGIALLGAVIAFGPEPQVDRAGSSPTPGVSASNPGQAEATASGSAVPASSMPGSSVAASASPGPGGTGAALHIGERAPILAVPQVGGGFVDVAALNGRPVWVVFLSTTCERCADELPLVTGFLARYASTGLVGLAIDVRDTEGAVATFAKRLGATFPFGLDLDGSAQREWDVLGLPTHFWIDKDGIIRDASPGVTTPATMVHGLSQILPGVTVTP